MGYDIQYLCKAETRRLVCLIAALFATVILLQFIELPKGNLLGSIIFPGKNSQLVNTSTAFGRNSTVQSVVQSNVSSPTSVNSSSTYGEGNDGGFKNGTTVQDNSEQKKGVEDSFDLDDDTAPAPDDRTSLDDGGSRVDIISPSPNNNVTTIDSFLSENASKEISPVTKGEDGNTTLGPFSSPVASPVPAPVPSSSPNETLTSGSIPNSPPPPFIAVELNTSSAGSSLSDHVLKSTPQVKQRPKPMIRDVYTVADMNELLTKSYSTSNAMVPQWSSIVDQDLLYARSQIENAPSVDRGLYAHIYRNVSMFQRSYELMEQMLKVYIYREGQRPIFHSGPLQGIYASEGWFMKLMEGNKQFLTRHPERAHLFYLPFSTRNLEEQLYVPNSHSHKNLIQHLKNYLDNIVMKYPFWNRTGGADHFLVACHDWAPSETRRIMAKCIRALCNADVKEGFSFGKDVSLPETFVIKSKDPLRGVGGKSPSKRKTLAFFAGRMHGYVRPILLQHWLDKDPDMKIFGKLPKVKGNKNYIDYMKSSKYCICPKGYEVNSPRVVEALFFECVPVIISDNFVPPFIETLNWESFAVFVLEKDIPNLKDILVSIPERTYLRMQMRVKKVQQHFLWHPKPVKYDLFHMILHSIWYNRVFQFRPG